MSEPSINNCTNSDMSPSFLSLPRELRDQIYELVLLEQRPVKPFPFNFDRLTPGLFRVNKTIHHETTRLFYSQNRFSTMHGDAEKVAKFFEQIGRKNADSTRHLCIRFPHIEYPDSGNATLDYDTVGILNSIQSNCANLSTLTATIYSGYAIPIWLCVLDHPKIFNEALKLLDTRFRAISSLEEIIVKLPPDEDGGGAEVNGLIRRELKSYGWTIGVAEFEIGEEGYGSA